MSHFFNKRLSRSIILTVLITQNGILYSEEKSTGSAAAKSDKVEAIEEKQTEFEQLLDKELSKESGENNKENAKDSPNWFYQIFKTIIGLGFIIVLLYLFRKYMIFKNSFGNVQTGIINVLHEYPVATGKKLQIIEVGNRLLLIGVSDAGIQLVSEFKEKLPIDQIKLAVETYGKNETKDFWIELSKGISNKVQSWINQKNPIKKYEKEESQSWENLQLNARLKIQELREKKKIFDNMDNSNDDKM